jgi:phosphopantothenoylcysteine decarboxylase/phosphopantothenate--cysteine ligase
MDSRPFHVVVGVTGSVAAYRAADLARELMRHGCEVRVCLTEAAKKFVSPVLFESLTGNAVVSNVFDEPEPGKMAHIDWARWADAIVIAPATANTLAKLSGGEADDMLTTICLATTAPLVLAPAMNPQMYAAPPTQVALSVLAEREAVIVEALTGDVACGEHGQGKLASVDAIVAATLDVLGAGLVLAGKKVVITSGPTQEPIDMVRFISNRSSGKMGAALAKAAIMMGAEVTVVSGPGRVPLPLGADVLRVISACEMLGAARTVAEGADWIIGAAAVADYRPKAFFEGKRRRDGQPWTLELVPNPDIIATLARENPSARAVGFAAEPGPDTEPARAKLERKSLHAIAFNDVSDAAIGFDSDVNELTVLFSDGTDIRSSRRSKLGCSLWLLKALAHSVESR